MQTRYASFDTRHRAAAGLAPHSTRSNLHELLAIKDWFTRKVLAWRTSNTQEADFCAKALNEAVHRFGAPDIVNTDQGSPFTSFAWPDRLKRAGTHISMGGKGRCIGNPRAFTRTNGVHTLDMSRLWRSLKYQCIYLHAWDTGSQAKAGIAPWIIFYNQHRPHSALGGTPPAVFYRARPSQKPNPTTKRKKIPQLTPETVQDLESSSVLASHPHLTVCLIVGVVAPYRLPLPLTHLRQRASKWLAHG
ncbi:MAG: transposase [Paracoccaceae bacterium]